MEKLAAGTLSKQLFQCSHLSLLVAATPARMFKAARPETAFAGKSFLSGSYARRNLAGLSNHAHAYPNVTAYLTAFLKQRTSHPFASIGLVVGRNTAVHKDVQNQVGTYNLLLPVQLAHDILWLEDNAGQEAREV